jgi:lipid A 3-O-deacylase
MRISCFVFAITSISISVHAQQDGSDLHKGTHDAGVAIGAGPGLPVMGSSSHHDLATASVHYGCVLSDVVGSDHWYRGNWELRAELFGGAQFNSDVRYLVGALPVLRYNFATASRWVPFADLGGGVCVTDIGSPDLGGTFQFNEQAGIGSHIFLRPKTAVTIEGRFIHISNAGLSTPNGGLNAALFSAGLTWFF